MAEKEEIEITPEMIAAGEKVLAECALLEDGFSEIAERVFRAMLRARKALPIAD